MGDRKLVCDDMKSINVIFSPFATLESYLQCQHTRIRWNRILFAIKKPGIKQELKSIIFLCKKMISDLTSPKQIYSYKISTYNPLEISEDECETDDDD